MFMTRHPQPPPEAIEPGNPDQDAYAFLFQAVHEARCADRFRPDYEDDELIAQSLWAGVHGVVALHLVKGDGDWLQWRSARKTAEVLCQALLQGFLRYES
jgi:hypothetical protein